MNKKAQVGGPAQMIIGLFIALMVIGILQMVSVLTTSKVGASIDRSSLYTPTNAINESVTITIMADGSTTNSTTSANTGYDSTKTYYLLNASSQNLVKDTDYSVTVNGPNGVRPTVATLYLKTKQYNNTALYWNYVYGASSQAATSFDNLETNTYNSYSLGGTAQLVLAAMTIVATVFGIFYMVNGR
jgi:hypothetical protein